jgi:hypothetical protein
MFGYRPPMKIDLLYPGYLLKQCVEGTWQKNSEFFFNFWRFFF